MGHMPRPIITTLGLMLKVRGVCASQPFWRGPEQGGHWEVTANHLHAPLEHSLEPRAWGQAVRGHRPWDLSADSAESTQCRGMVNPLVLL